MELVLFSVAAAAAAVAATLGWALRRARRDASSLRSHLAAAQQGLQALQEAFARFAPASVIEDVIARGVSTRSEKKDVTVLFADIQGFTSMSESMDPAVLVDLLNGYFEAMTRAITRHRGHVGKFIGDGLLATFGALEPNPWQHNDACHAALAMREALAGYNAELAARGRPQLKIGVGVHRGEVVAGVIGSEQLLEYTVIGSHVNLASRVEGLTRKHGADILITDAVRSGLDARFQVRECQALEVKGVSEPVPTFAVVAFVRQQSANLA